MYVCMYICSKWGKSFRTPPRFPIRIHVKLLFVEMLIIKRLFKL